MCSIVEILCVIKGKIMFVCCQHLHNLHVMDFSSFDLAVNFLYFLSNSDYLSGYFSDIKK